MRVRIWSPARTPARRQLPLLIAHDGPAYDKQAGLTRFCAEKIASADLPPHRVALLDPGTNREEWYSANPSYARALAREVLPAIEEATATKSKPVGMGASLGALALLHAHRRAPRAFQALFLQSGSFFVPRFDSHESGFARYPRIVRFTRAVRRGPPRDHAAIPITLTCGADEENVHNNRATAQALREQGHPGELHELPGAHDYPSWRAAFEPHLTALLQRAWT